MRGAIVVPLSFFELLDSFFAVLPETSGKTARSIKIEQIREMRGAVARAPKFSTRRAVLLDDAETMNDAAANALALGLLGLCVCAMAGGGFSPFIYQQF